MRLHYAKFRFVSCSVLSVAMMTIWIIFWRGEDDHLKRGPWQSGRPQPKPQDDKNQYSLARLRSFDARRFARTPQHAARRSMPMSA